MQLYNVRPFVFGCFHFLCFRGSAPKYLVPIPHSSSSLRNIPLHGYVLFSLPRVSGQMCGLFHLWGDRNAAVNVRVQIFAGT